MGVSIGNALVASASALVSAAAEGQNPLEDMLKKIIAQGGGAPMGTMPPQRAYPKGFLEQANTSSFSMRFKEGADAALRLGEKLPRRHAGMGTAHWELDFRGVSVGKSGSNWTFDPLFCKAKGMASKDQRSPCGA